MESPLKAAAVDVPSLVAVFVTVMPDCLLYDSWTREGEQLEPESTAAYFGDLVRANREGLKSLGSWSSEMQVTIESGDKLVVLREIRSDFVAACIFEAGVALGMVRFHLKRLLDRIAEALPQVEAERRPRAVRIVEFLSRYAPDPHAVLMRVSLRTGLPIEALQAPERLSEPDTEKLETAAKRILNLPALNV